MKIELLPNIGKKLAEKLETVGVDNAENLIRIGSRKAFLKVKSELEDGCLNMLYALEGAVQGIRWHSLSKQDRTALKEFYDSIELG
jgi:TfoX C-terminal domain